MERKTKIDAEEGKQDLLVTREFELPVDLLFKAFVETEIFEEWMGTKVIRLETRSHGGYRFETSDPSGNVVFSANGVFHEVTPDKRIIRTFEMEGTPFPVQLEFLVFEPIDEDHSRLTMQIVYKSPADRDRMLQLPFASGLNIAHNRIEGYFKKLK